MPWVPPDPAMDTLIPLTRRPIRDRVHAALLRRIDACAERRTAYALAPGDDAAFAAWCRERDRGDRLRRALIAHLLSCPRPAALQP